MGIVYCDHNQTQLAQLPFKALVAGVVLAGLAVTIPSPVADRLDNSLEDGRIAQHRPPLSHRNVMAG